MTKSRNTAIILFCISLSLLLVQFLIRVDTYYLSDPLVKMIQVISLWKQNWSTEGILSPTKDLDPLFLMSPFNESFVFLHEGKLIGQYPIGFTFFYSLFGFLPFPFLPYLNFVFLILFGRLLFKNGILPSVLVLTILGTVAFPLLVDFSENGLFLILAGYGYTFLFQAFLNHKKENWVWGNIFLGLSLWFRLEGILLFLAIQLTIGYISFYIKKQPLRETAHPIRYIIFLIFLLFFLIWNAAQYSHPFGTRYLTNFGKIENQFYEQIEIFLAIAFTYPRSNVWSLGFFIHTPIFLYALVKLQKKQIFQNLNLLFHLAVVLLFLSFVAFTSPNDGVTLTGRYLLVLVYPLSFLLNDQMEEFKKNKIRLYALITWSYLCTLLILVVFYFSSQELKKLRNELSQFNSPLIITTNELLSGSYGLNLLDQKVISLRSEYFAKYLFYNLQNVRQKEFMILTVGKETKYNRDEKDVFAAILSEAKPSGYDCSKEERSARVIARSCIKIEK
ncbi:LA_3751/LA_3752 family putative glycosyltransferase [Leptospira chreensis]|uniref:LA_3751/LA_3752 family putative glycosyltransferase n=1 Tax=Leptospira chreensis TaxID=2810035 RepID=UPI001E5F613A|nr:dolichyl-phosphate-mannose-protein mannosyltransferase [Leptospira chreensis]